MYGANDELVDERKDKEAALKLLAEIATGQKTAGDALKFLKRGVY